MSSFSLESAETAVTRFTRGHFSELIKKDAGGEAVLYAAKHDIHGNVMVKVFSSPNNKYSEQEVKILIKVTFHQNIVRLLGSFYFEDGTDAIRSGYVMEFMANGSLSAVIHDLSIQYDDNQVYSWIQQAGRGIAYLHSHNVIHRDVNTRNMLLGETIGVLKISDFGLAKPDATITERNTSLVGTIVYMAPEVIDDQGVNSAADVYSLGISTWEMFHRKKPFYEYDSLSLFSLGTSIINGTRPKIELRMEEEMKNLILRSLQAQYTLRPLASDFTAIADKLKSKINVSPNAPEALSEKMAQQFDDLLVSVTPPSRSLSSEIQNSFDSKLTLLIGGFRNDFNNHLTVLAFEHNTKTWKKLDVEISFLISGAVVLDEELYVFRGIKLGLFKLNPENRSWIEMTDIPTAEWLTELPSVAYRSKIYVAVENTVFAYHPAVNSWSDLAPIKKNMRIEGIVVYNNKLYIFGRDRNSRIQAGYYDTVEDGWKYLSLDFTVLCLYIPAVTYKNEVVFFDDPDVYVSNLDGRTPWKTLPRLKSCRYSAAVFTCGNSLFVAGGRLDDDDEYSDEVESFDGVTWTEMPRMPYGLTVNTTVTATGNLAKQLLKWSC